MKADVMAVLKTLRKDFPTLNPTEKDALQERVIKIENLSKTPTKTSPTF
jgi:hypothetical protein